MPCITRCPEKKKKSEASHICRWDQKYISASRRCDEWGEAVWRWDANSMKQKCCFESGGSDQGSWLRKRPSPSPASAFTFYTTCIWLGVHHPGFPPRRNSSWLAGTWLLPFLLLRQLLMVCSLAYFAVSCSQLWFVILSYRPNPSLIRDLYVPLTTDRNIFLSHTHCENKANKSVRCSDVTEVAGFIETYRG